MKVPEEKRRRLKELRGSRETKHEFDSRLKSYLKIRKKNPDFPWKKGKAYGKTIENSIVEMIDSPGFPKEKKMKEISEDQKKQLQEFRKSEGKEAMSQVKKLRMEYKKKKLKKKASRKPQSVSDSPYSEKYLMTKEAGVKQSKEKNPLKKDKSWRPMINQAVWNAKAMGEREKAKKKSY